MESAAIIQNNASASPEGGNRSARVLSRALSLLLHPLLIPFYAMAAIILGDPLTVTAPTHSKVFFSLIVLLNVSVIPAIALGLIKTLGYVTGPEDRRSRVIVIALVALCYGICIFMIGDRFFAFLVRKFLVAAFCCALASIPVAYFYNISMHMVASGGALALLGVLWVAGVGNYIAPFAVCVILTGLLGSARLYLGRNTLGQVGAGFITGFAVSALSLFFLI